MSTTNETKTALPKPTVKCSKCNGTGDYRYANGHIGECSKCEDGFRYTRQDAVIVSRARIEKNLVELRAEYRGAVACLQEAKASGRMIRTAEQGVSMALENGKRARAALDFLSNVNAFDTSVTHRLVAMGFSPNVCVH